MKQKKQRKQRRHAIPLGLLIALFVVSSVQAAEGLPRRPAGFITDTANVLSSLEKEYLENDLRSLRDATGVEVAVVTLETTDGLPIEEIALELGRRWGVGGEGDRGIVVVFAKQEREARVEVGYGLEGEIPDIVSKAILEEVMIPKFQEGEFGQGIIAGIQALKEKLGNIGTSAAPRTERSSGAGVPSSALLFFLFFLFEWILIIMARTKSWWLGGVIGAAVGTFVWMISALLLAIPIFAIVGLLLDYFVSKNYRRRGRTAWWAGGGWGPGPARRSGFRVGGGRGGFGGFSGGSFGGGGASARW